MLPQRHRSIRLPAILALAIAGVLTGLSDTSAQNSERQETERRNDRQRTENRERAETQEAERSRRDATETDSDRQRSSRNQNDGSGERAQRNQTSASDRQQENDQRQSQRGDRGRQSDAQEDQHADDESPELGLIAGSCPGAGVCVMGTAWGGPAQRAGIQHGDYILSVNDRQVSTPVQLKEMLQRWQPGQEIDLEIWRQGQTMQRTVVLAAQSQKSPRGQQAWIGVQIEANESGNARPGDGRSARSGQSSQILIASVQPDSPAAQAGLQQGDVLTQIGGEDIDSIDTLMDQVQAAGPGQELELEVIRDGQRQIVTVDVGNIDNAPTSWQRRAFRRPQQMPSSSRSGAEDQSMDAVLDRMRQQIRSLQQQVEQLQSETSQSGLSAENRAQDSPNRNRDQRDSAETRRSDSGTRRNAESRQRDEDVNRNRDASAEDRQAAVIKSTSEPILVAQRYRDRDRNWRNHGNRRYSGNNWYDRNWHNRSNYRYYRSPRYGNSYYWNRGRPYYNNRWNRSGNREGFRISPYGFSYYW